MPSLENKSIFIKQFRSSNGYHHYIGGGRTMICFWFIKQIKWPWNCYACCVFADLNYSKFPCQIVWTRPNGTISSVLLYLFYRREDFFFSFIAFNIVTNIVYKSINFAMCQFMRFSATHYGYRLIIEAHMSTTMCVWNSTTNNQTLYHEAESTNKGWFVGTMIQTISFGISILMRSHKNNKCCGIVLFWLFGWNNFCKCIRRYSINFHVRSILFNYSGCLHISNTKYIRANRNPPCEWSVSTIASHAKNRFIHMRKKGI